MVGYFFRTLRSDARITSNYLLFFQRLSKYSSRWFGDVQTRAKLHPPSDHRAMGKSLCIKRGGSYILYTSKSTFAASQERWAKRDSNWKAWLRDRRFPKESMLLKKHFSFTVCFYLLWKTMSIINFMDLWVIKNAIITRASNICSKKASTF